MTLIEVLLAIVLLAFGLYGVVDLYGHQTRYVRRAGWEARAQGLAQAYLARVAAMGYEALESHMQLLGKSADGPAAPLFPGQGRATQDDQFEWNVWIQKVPDTAPAQIRVRVQVAPSPMTRGAIEAMGMRLESARKEAVCHVVAP